MICANTYPANSESTPDTFISALSVRPLKQVESIFKPYRYMKASKFVQHLVLWVCRHPDPSIFDQHSTSRGVDCTDMSDLPSEYKHCFNIFFVLDNPDQIFESGYDNALSIGDQHSRYLMINARFDVAKEEFIGREVEIGMRLWTTNNWRRNELQQLITGAHVSLYGIIIPARNRCHRKG
ncbi:unnamed protein product [Medioppia subpectinata]|uniref:Uncharacterized protein n=1 Tax=Medioppia subpectinata TaxID=1979941 RepID=A0A7R9KMD6_9ACAR|nr:unnamed protein product [Medioppia subpectinata]CAG2106173.1 unnamed protein product [Medioppia subpectinata]